MQVLAMMLAKRLAIFYLHVSCTLTRISVKSSQVFIEPTVSLKGPAFMHKSRMNPNGSFKVGKSWDLKELKSIEALDVCRSAVVLTSIGDMVV